MLARFHLGTNHLENSESYESAGVATTGFMEIMEEPMGKVALKCEFMTTVTTEDGEYFGTVEYKNSALGGSVFMADNGDLENGAILDYIWDTVSESAGQ